MSIIEEKNLLETYRAIESKTDLLGNRENKILLPVNINLFRHDEIGYKSSFPTLNFKYKDEYSFEDKLLIYDLKTGFNRGGKHLLDDLKRSQKLTYYKNIRMGFEVEDGTDYKDYEYLRKTKEHIDWTDNGYGLRLSRILNLEPTHRNVFSPADKNIHLDYNHPHIQKMNLFSLYLIPGREQENLHQKIKFGKLKRNNGTAKDIFGKKYEEKNSWCQVKDRVLDEEQISNLSIREEGYEGECDKITLKHGDLNSNAEEKWSTPYVAYDYRKSTSTKWQEYYQYVLGEYSEKQGKSQNLLENKNQKIWAVDYNNIFRIENKSNHLQINIDKSLLPENPRDFLRISNLFKFEFFYRERGEHKKISFDIGKIVEGEAKIFFGDEQSMFSDFHLTIGLKNEDWNGEIELMDGLGEKKYSVNVDHLRRNNIIHHRIQVERPTEKNLMPSQFLNDEEMDGVFYFVSSDGKKKIKLSELEIKNLKIFREYNDEDGILKMKFKDFLTGEEREAVWEGMAKIPSGHKLIVRAEDEETAKKILRTKEELNNLPKYFWDSLQFTASPKNDFTMAFREHKITYGGPNVLVGEQWNKLINSKIELFNDLNFHTESLILDEEKAQKPIVTWFKSKDMKGNEKSLSGELIFTKIDENERFVKVSVSINNGKFNDKRDFDFQISKNKRNESPKITPASIKRKDDSPFSAQDNVQKIIVGAGCAIVGGGITLLFSRPSSPLRRKF